MSTEDMLESAKVVEDNTPKLEEPTVTDREPSMNFMQEWFELTATDRLNTEKQDRIKYIYDFVTREVGSNEPFNIFQYMRNLMYRIGAPRMGQSKLQHIYQWVKIQNQRKLLDLKEQELKNG